MPLRPTVFSGHRGRFLANGLVYNARRWRLQMSTQTEEITTAGATNTDLSPGNTAGRSVLLSGTTTMVTVEAYLDSAQNPFDLGAASLRVGDTLSQLNLVLDKTQLPGAAFQFTLATVTRVEIDTAVRGPVMWTVDLVARNAAGYVYPAY